MTAVRMYQEMQPEWLTNFVEVYQELGTDNLHKLDDVYSADIEFSDPMHSISGLEKLRDYFSALYINLSSCSFQINHVFFHEDQAAVYWTMTYCHPKLKGNQPVQVEGHSRICGMGDKVTYHRDYLDLGAMLYEQLPLLGPVIRQIKKRAGR